MQKTSLFCNPAFFLLAIVALSIVLFVGVLVTGSRVQAFSFEQIVATLATPEPIVEYHAEGTAPDADIYPALAYDATTQRYLAVWLSARNALSATDGIDVYGQFLDQNSQPQGQQFRISDSNSGARSSRPTVTAGEQGFVVGWTVRSDICRLAIQNVTDSSEKADQLLEFGDSVHQHSPRILYNAQRQRYVVVYVSGNDYLPPTVFGADVADCGNDATSRSQAKLAELHLSDDAFAVDSVVTVSDGVGGAFRPALAYHATQARYLVTWEDRRESLDIPYQFAVYGQFVKSDLSIEGRNIVLTTEANYTNGDNSSTWTPRPVVTAGSDQFLALWYHKENITSPIVWRVQGSFVTASNVISPSFDIAEVAFTRSITNHAPTGFIDSAYQNAIHEYLVTLNGHTETFLGVATSTRIQRIGETGQLLKLDGTTRTIPTSGDIIDPSDELQFSVAVAGSSNVSGTTYLLAYGRHAPNQNQQDLDIWGNRIQLQSAPTATATATASPTVTTLPSQTPVPPTATVTVAPTATKVPIETPATPLPTATPTQRPVYLPLIQKNP